MDPPSYCIEVDGGLRETEGWRLRPKSSSNEPAPVQSGALSYPATIDVEDDSFGEFEWTDPAASKTGGGGLGTALGHGPPDVDLLTVDMDTSSHGPDQPEPRAPLAAGAPLHSHAGEESEVLHKFHAFLKTSAPEVAHQIEEEHSREELNRWSAPGELSSAHPDLMLGGRLEASNVEANGVNGMGDDFGDFEAAEWEPPPPPIQGSPPSRNLSPVKDVNARRDAVLDVLGRTSPAKQAPTSQKVGAAAVQEYGEAWICMLTKAAGLLEEGSIFWTSLRQLKVPEALVFEKYPRVQQYMAALGRVYLVASVVKIAADMLGLLRMVPELQQGWARCQAAWDSECSMDGGAGQAGGQPSVKGETGPLSSPPSFGEAVLAAAGAMGLNLSEEMDAVHAAPHTLSAMSLDDFPRLLAWCDGLDALTLLPLSVLPLVPTAAALGLDRRPCWVPLMNFWLGCVSSQEPELD